MLKKVFHCFLLLPFPLAWSVRPIWDYKSFNASKCFLSVWFIKLTYCLHDPALFFLQLKHAECCINVRSCVDVFCVELQDQVAALEHTLNEEQQRCREERVRRRLLHNTLVVRLWFSGLIHFYEITGSQISVLRFPK